MTIYALLPQRSEWARRKYWRKFVISFLHWDGAYEFLQRFWPQPSTRKPVDYYGCSHFQTEHLPRLREAIEKAQAALAEMPDEWEEIITDPCRHEDLPDRETVRKESLEQDLEYLLVAIHNTSILGGLIEFVG